jgi:hypothetical protein
MQNSLVLETRGGLPITLFILGLVTALVLVPSQFRSEANSGKGLFTRTTVEDPSLPNYDIRTAKEEGLDEYFASARQSAGKDAAVVADLREGFVRGENALRTRLPDVKFEYNEGLRIPEVITPDVWKSSMELLTGPSTMKRSEILRNFIRENNDLIGVTDAQADSLRVMADYTNPNGYMSFAHLEQLINGVPVFSGDIKAGFNKDGRMLRVINNLAPGLDYESLSSDFNDPVAAVRSAFRHINSEPTTLDTSRNDAASSDLKVVFGTGDSATTAEKMYFPVEPGVARTAWRVIIWEPVTAYMVIVDAKTGTLLWRKNAGEDQTTSATYSVYTNPNAFIPVADNPAPLTPGPINPTLGTQGAILTSRTNVTAIGNEAPNWGANNLGWMTDGTNITDGNTVEAGVDRVAPDGVDAPQPGDTACPGAGCRIFTSTWNPPPGNPPPGDAPLTAPAQRGAVTQMFYVMNLWHDVLYNLGFTEPAFNFQNDNFGRGGVAGDRVRAEGQDSSGTNNANFQTLPDGTRPRMQMYIWTGPTPDYDGTTDADVIIHEVSHGLSNRLHGNTAGLSTNMARGMGEGWGDFYGHTLLAEPSDPINGVYTTGGYATYLLSSPTDTSNYYYGIRRFPKAVMAFTGGAGNLPHSPLTFRHVNSNCNVDINTVGAYPRGPVGSATCDQVHNLGEIWSSALWEIRALMVTRLGFSAGTRRVLQVVTDGMKLAPNGPTFLQERDAIIMAASVLPAIPEASADVADVREGFRRRGMGFSASIQNAGTGANNTAVTEGFDFPNVQVIDPFSVSDAVGDNDGFPEPTENVTLTVSVTNQTGAAITNVVVSVAGGGNANVGTMNDGQTTPVQLAYTVPAAMCGSFHDVMIGVSSDAGMQAPKTYTFRLGVPVGGPPAEFTNSTPIDMPNGQPTTTSGPFNPYPSNISVSGLSGTKIMKVRVNGYHHEFEDDLDFLLVGPGGQKYIFMSDVGGITEQLTPITFSVSDSGDILLPDATGMMNGVTYKPSNVGANDAFDAPAPAGPYTNAAPGGSDTFASVFGTDGAALNGTWSLYGDDDAGSDPGRIDNGWSLVFESDNYTCEVGPPLTPEDSRADFDGDGRTDLSVFRPAEGNWYLNRSTAGFAVLNWGIAGDTLVPGDYDNDNKTDTAVFRANANPANPDFYVLNSNGFVVSGVSWGTTGDIPVVGDYDGDGRSDPAVFRPSENVWYILNSGGGITITSFGQAGDVPVVGDFNGDGMTDITVYRSGTWMSQLSGGGSLNAALGAAGDFLVPADYTGDDADDIAVFRPSTGEWFVRNSTGGAVTTTPWGTAGDVPVPGDYDGDGTDDLAIYRNGTWWLNRSTSGISVQNFGISTDLAIPRQYLP